MSKAFAIEKLQQISALDKERTKLEKYIDIDRPRDTYKAATPIVEEIAAKKPSSEKLQSACVTLPKIEFDTPLKEYFVMLAIIFAAASLFGLIFIPEGKWLYFGLLVIVACVQSVKRIWKYIKREKVNLQRAQQYEKDLDAYRQVIADYKNESNAIAQQLPLFKTTYQQAFPKCLQIYCDGEKQEVAAKEKLVACTKEINENGFISVKYVYLAEEIIDILQTGRADEYKEALNLAITEDRQRKMEEARRAEEERRQAEMARQAEEDRIRAAVDAKMQAARERDMQQKTERERKDAGLRKCRNCVNYSKCRPEIKASGAGLTCAAFRPR